MSLLPDYNAIILDMDGLILDTESTYFTAWQQAAFELGYAMSDVFCTSLSGLPFSVIELKLTEYFAEEFPFTEFYALSAEFWRSNVEREGIAVKKGGYDLLTVLQETQTPFCLATNSPEFNARECLQYAGIENLFSIIVCRDHVQKPKPAADIFLRAAAKMQQPIQSCLVVEDSLTGLLAANNANAFSILIPSSPDVDGKMQALASIVLNDLFELCLLLQGKYDNSNPV
ncbi:hypothetical protein AU255_06945 [Methyloprofundus sedimenti]|uniref:Haloacid dehalogenase n=1 Tax=Methyloprofundus sedimenti TaxID=1420851 RepID=A0A1V8M7T7_9GAMM|nr:HAD family phosphatase [Methyloprofundus sedimenti]OQK17599.1 hypothetical protein AU255_06945 [Methyloprofundus sedimenti]